jgi:CRP-like cAMP-binding protein
MAAIRPHNKMLAALSSKDLALLTPHLRELPLPLRYELERPGRRIENVYFIESGIASVVAEQSDEVLAEVGLIGCEGMSGMAILLGADPTPHSTYMQVAGEGQKISTKDFRGALKASDTMRDIFLKYVHVFMMQTSQTAITNSRRSLTQRLARWILMAHDRSRDNTIPLTHEFLSLMLGVRRAGVTETLQILKQQKLIETGRNLIVVRNRSGLQKTAGAAYGGPEREFRRLFG